MYFRARDYFVFVCFASGFCGVCVCEFCILGQTFTSLISAHLYSLSLSLSLLLSSSLSSSLVFLSSSFILP